MELQLIINSEKHEIDCTPSTALLAALRGLGFHRFKFGDEGKGSQRES